MPPLAQHGLASFERQAPTRVDDQPVVDTARATTPTPAVLALAARWIGA